MYNGYYHCRLCNAIYKSCGTGSENYDELYVTSHKFNT